MDLIPRFTNKRRALQLGWYGLRHGTKVLEKFNSTNLYLARRFNDFEITCNVCGNRSKVWFEMHSIREKREHKVGLLRETLECLNCLSRMRYRIMAHALLDECRQVYNIEASSTADLRTKVDHLRILDTDAFSPAARILKGSKGYSLSSYVTDRPFGTVDDKGIYNVDLQAMTFPDCTFDVILSSDVMEHVRDFDRACAETYRCLKPGGAHIFTVPFEDPPPLTKTLIDTTSSEDVYLEPAQVHGDDNLTAGVPAYRIYGMDLPDNLNVFGFQARLVQVKCRDTGIFNGQYIVARRPP